MEEILNMFYVEGDPVKTLVKIVLLCICIEAVALICSALSQLGR